MEKRLVFKTHNVNVDTIYELATILNNRGFILNPKAKGSKVKDTKSIVVDLQEGIFTPYNFFIDRVTDRDSYYIELKD